MSALQKLSARIPPPLRSAIGAGLSLLAGLAVALVLHYLLFRVGLPSKPFIYAAF
jgi:hypothetical protein